MPDPEVLKLKGRGEPVKISSFRLKGAVMKWVGAQNVRPLYFVIRNVCGAGSGRGTPLL